jgi:TetR/AcrR family transcriptional repressor of nem operon
MSRVTDFDREEIIEKAMQVFWENGYQATSLNDLMQATGLLKGSLYNSFKSKENLFLLCLERYGERSKSFFFAGGDPKLYLQEFFSRLVKEGSKKDYSKGCLIMNSCLELAESDSDTAKKAQKLFRAIELNFEKVLLEMNFSKEEELKRHKTALVTAAFSIREISKFKKDKKFLEQIANNALMDLGVKL